MSGETVYFNVWVSPFKKRDYIRIFESICQLKNPPYSHLKFPHLTYQIRGGMK